MSEQLRNAAGYLAILITPALLAVGVWIDEPWLAFGTVMLGFPFARVLFGAVIPEAPVVWDERIATFLHRLSFVYAGGFLLVVATVLQDWATHQAYFASDILGLGLSLWITLLLATCVAHDLIHRRDARAAFVGHLIAGIAGYPMLAQEHHRHHARSGDTQGADWPRVTESVWQFAGRRSRRVWADAFTSGTASGNVHVDSRSVRGLIVASAITIATWLAFSWMGGWSGFAVYFAVIVGVTFGMQLITYLQHWGLGDDNLPDAHTTGYAWEDDCRFQAWITLNLSLHQAHHRKSDLTYYRVTMSPDAPRLPAGYVILMVACLFPALWRRLMRPALQYWQRSPRQPRSFGRKLVCFTPCGEELISKVNR